MAHPVMLSKSKSSAVLEPDVLKEASTEEMYRELLRRMGEDPNRDGLIATPARVEKTMAFLTKGYQRGSQSSCCAARCSTSITTRW